MSRVRGRMLKPAYPASMEGNLKYTCPIDRKDPELRHKHYGVNVMAEHFVHVEMFDYMCVTVVFQVVRTLDKKSMVTGIASLGITSLGTFYDGKEPTYLDRTKEIGHVVAGLMKRAYRVKQLE